MMRLSPLLVGVLAIMPVAVARAEEQGEPARLALQLTYRRGEGTESCPSEETLGHLLIGAFGYDPISPAAAAGVTIAIARRREKFHAEVTITGEGGALLWAQELEDVRCMALLRNVVAVAYLEARHTLDPPAAPPALAPEAPKEPPPLFPPPPLPAPLRAPSPPAPKPVAIATPPLDSATIYRLGIAALVRPAPAPWDLGLSVFGEAQRRALSLDLEAAIRASPPTSLADRTLQTLYVGASLLPCYHLRTLAAFTCLPLGAEGRWTTWTPASSIEKEHTGSWLALTFGARFGFEKEVGGRVGLRGFLDAGGRFDALGPPKRLGTEALAPVLGLGVAVTVRP